MFKVLVFLKAKSGMTRNDFVDYYENHHVKIAREYIDGNVVEYKRRYLNRVNDQEIPYDVVTELWFDKKEDYTELRLILDHPDVRARIVADEEILFDRSATRYAYVEEA